jgi:hypothetical protein
MGKDLPDRAERFLFALARKLSSLSSAERDTVLLELRSHLADRAAQGETALDAALSALGDPAELAAGFDQRDGARMAPVPGRFAMPERRMRVREVLLEVRATFLASRDGLMMVGLVLTAVAAAATLLWWTDLRVRGPSFEGSVALAVQWAASLLAYCAGYRIVLADKGRPWRIAASTFRFAAAMTAVDAISLAGTFGIDRLVTTLIMAAGSNDAVVTIGRPAWSTLATLLFFCITLRIQPWLVALAIERRDVTIGASWRGTSGRMLNILRGWVVVVLPLYILHLGLHSYALEHAPVGLGMIPLAVMAGILSVSIALAAILLNATIFRWAVGEPIPSPRPFATEPADPLTVEECRARLAMLLQAQDN